MFDDSYLWQMPSKGRGLRRTASKGQRGQSITEFALLAPLVFFILALIFTGSQYLNAVVGLNGAARAGAIVVSNGRAAGPMTQSSVNTAATLAVNREQGCNCFVAVADQASCAAGANCVWTEVLKAPSGTDIETVHVSYTVSSYLGFISSFAVSAQAGAES